MNAPSTDYVRSPEDCRHILIAYLLAKVQGSDWHGVSDAANDLRVLEAQFPHLSERK